MSPLVLQQDSSCDLLFGKDEEGLSDEEWLSSSCCDQGLPCCDQGLSDEEGLADEEWLSSCCDQGPPGPPAVTKRGSPAVTKNGSAVVTKKGSPMKKGSPVVTKGSPLKKGSLFCLDGCSRKYVWQARIMYKQQGGFKLCPPNSA